MKNEESIIDLAPTARMGRKSFLIYSGAAAGTAAFLAACKKNNTNNCAAGGLDLGCGDIGILNYAYALEQLEAAFYTAVLAGTYYTGLSASSTEAILLSDIQKHEVCHRDFLKAALGSSAIQGLTPNFSAIDFTNRTTVLTYAKTFEDLGVSAYNGAAYYISSSTYLLLAGKIVSVEARHASAIRDLLNPDAASNGFAGDDVVSASSGLDESNTPQYVLSQASAFIKETLNASQLPQ
jgi:hypothetical protein